MALTGIGTVPLPSLNSTVIRLHERLHWGVPLSQKPITRKHIPKDDHNRQICNRYKTGERLEDIAYNYHISAQCASQIIHHCYQ